MSVLTAKWLSRLVGRARILPLAMVDVAVVPAAAKKQAPRATGCATMPRLGRVAVARLSICATRNSVYRRT